MFSHSCINNEQAETAVPDAMFKSLQYLMSPSSLSAMLKTSLSPSLLLVDSPLHTYTACKLSIKRTSLYSSYRIARLKMALVGTGVPVTRGIKLT